MSGFVVQTQRDFSAGAFANPSRELIPANGFAECVNGLLDEDGTIYRRGGSKYKSSSDFAHALTMLWDGYLVAGRRTVFASSAEFGVLDSDDSTPLNLGNTGTDGKRPASGDYLLFTPCGTAGSAGQIAVYGGSRKTTAYSTGTATTIIGSRTVSGSGTSWLANVDAGMILVAGGSVLGTVQSVDSNTQITLKDGAYGTVTAFPYSLNPVYLATPAGVKNVSAVATVSSPARLCVAYDSDIAFSAPGSPFSFAATDYHRLPQGATVVGMESLRNTLFVFSTGGVFTITGMDFDLTDPQGNIQQRLEQINREVVLWDQRGIAGSSGALIVPATDDVYLLTEYAAPKPLSGPIRKQYRDYVKQGYQCGFGAVYRNHYFLPILQGSTWVDTLVLRLDQGGWTNWDGHGGTSTGFATRASTTTRSPLLLSAGGKRVLDMSDAFNPSAPVKNDADGTTHELALTTRDYTLDSGRKALIKKMRLRYELNDAASDAPTVALDYALGQNSSNPVWGNVTWGSFTWGASTTDTFVQIDGEAPVESGVTPYVWQVIPTQAGVRSRFVRFRFRSVGPCSRFAIRAIELFIRPGLRQ